MTDLVLVYPYFSSDQSIFKFPPLGLGQLASYARSHGYSVEIVDCTFMSEEEALRRVQDAKARVVGISCMSSMQDAAIRFAHKVRQHCDLLVAGGPLPTAVPAEFVDHFDLVVLGEGEDTLLEILNAQDAKGEFNMEGIAYLKDGKIAVTRPRALRKDLDSLPFPARDLFEHGYKSYFMRKYGYTITSLMASRGCPFDCEFCSRPVFGSTYRGRDASKIVDEMEEIGSYGYERIWVADDVFPISKKAGLDICDEIIKRGLDPTWESLCRVDVLDDELASCMRRAGCHRIFFGMETGNERMLKLMNKRISVEQGIKAVKVAKAAGIKVGGFFILGYPSETNETLLDTIRLASSLPFDYLSLTLPYPIPGTRLYERVKGRMVLKDIKVEKHGLVKHSLIYKSEFSSSKLKFGIAKAMAQHYARSTMGSYYGFVKPFEIITDYVFRVLR